MRRRSLRKSVSRNIWKYTPWHKRVIKRFARSKGI